MIPKIIHYCWFGGGNFPESVQKCIDSWKKYCPDYEIKEWNESNFDVNYNDFTREAYAAKKYAFVSDVARLYALTECGGIYMDTDVEVIKPFDDAILYYKGLTCFQSKVNQVGTGFLACEKGFPFFKEFLSFYDTVRFLQDDSQYNMTPNTCYLTDLCEKNGLQRNNQTQVIRDLTVLPRDYFSAKNHITKEINITENTYAVHHFYSSWNFEIKDYEKKLKAKYKVLPMKVAKFIAYIKFRGFRAAWGCGWRFIKEKFRKG